MTCPFFAPPQLLGAGVSAMSKQMRQTASLAEDVHASASAAVRRDPRIESALGGPVTTSKPLSVSSSSSSINGVSSTTTSVQFIAEGPGGRQANVSVRSSSGGTAGRSSSRVGDRVLMEIVVQLPGQQAPIRVDPGVGAGGEIVDVDDYSVR